MAETKSGEVDPRIGGDHDALLYDFGVESYKLGTKHTAYLDELIRFLQGRTATPMVVSLDGYADSTGTAAYNDTLSKNREQAVAHYLTSHSRIFEPAGPHKINTDFEGFSMSPPGPNPRFRSVRVVLHAPGVVPPPVPVSSGPAALSQVTVWINAFINKDVSDGSGGFLTFRLASGPAAGLSVIPGPIPLFKDCYATDDRDFDSSISASARCHAQIAIDFSGSAPLVSTKIPKILKCSPSQRFRISDGAILNTATGVVKGDLTPDPATMSSGSTRVSIKALLATHNPVARAPMMIPLPFPPFVTPNPIPTSFDPPPPVDPDIDVDGTITIDALARTVEFSGKLDRFPFFEMYASTDGGATSKTVFRIPPNPGDTPVDLFGAANRDVATILGRPAKVTL